MHCLIDTNIFLRVLTKDDTSTFNQCVDLLTAIKEGKIKAVTTTICLAEVVWTLKAFYKRPKSDILLAYNAIINLNGLSIVDGYDHGIAATLYERYNVKYIDALIASIKSVRTKEMTVVSFDRDFDKLGVLRVEPKSVLLELSKK